MMKKICLLVAFIVLGKMWSLGQGYPLQQNLGSDSTIVVSKGALQSRLINITFVDTSAANNQRIKAYPGAQIATTTGGLNLWVRNANATAWVPISTGSGNNIYTIDGTLAGNRILSGDGNSLTFTGLSSLLLSVGNQNFTLRSDSGSLTRRLSYAENLGSGFTMYSLVDKNYVDSAITSSPAGTVTSIATNNGTGITGGTITSTGTLAIDTLLISTRAWRQKGVDSLQANINLKLNISDTAAMLAPYMLIADTSGMLSNYFRTAGIGLLSSGQTVYADTLLLSTRAWRQKGIDSVAALINNNVSGSPNYVSKFTGTNTIGNSQIFDNGTAVGINTTSPTARLEINGNTYINGQVLAGDTNAFTIPIQGAYFTPYVFGRKSVTNTLSGDPRTIGVLGQTIARGSVANRLMGGAFYTISDSSNAQNISQLRALQGWAFHNGTGTVSSAWGNYQVVTNNTTGTITNAYGSVSGVENRLGTTNKLHGQSVEVWNNNGGSIDTAFGQVISVYNNNVASNIGTVYGLSIGKGMITSTGGTHYWRNYGTIGTSYGLYLDTSIDVGLTKYALYSFSRSNSYVRGNLGLGTTTPDSLLTVAEGANFQRGIRASGLPAAPGTKALRIDAAGTISYSDTLIDAGGTVTSVATNNGTGITGGTITTTGTLSIDTLLLSTRAWRQKGVDSLQANINQKLNISDTASMLSPYLRSVGYGLGKTGQSVYADSATLSAYYLRRKDSLTATNSLGYVTKTTLADTASAIRGAAVSGFVPYLGATQNLNLGALGLRTDFTQFRTSPTSTDSIGRLVWNTDFGTLNLGMGTSGVIQQIGLENYIYVHNSSGQVLTDGIVVYMSGATGNHVSAKLADNRYDSTALRTIGVVTQTIGIGALGYVTTFGFVHDLNLAAFNEGDILYLDTAGGITNIEPVQPKHNVQVGVVARANAGNGILQVSVKTGLDLEKLDDVLVTSPTNNSILYYNSSQGLWKDTTIAAAGLAVTQVNTNSATGITGGPITTTGTISADTLLLSTRAWRQKGIDSVAALLPAAISGTTNYVSKFISSSAIGNSQIFDNGTSVGINTASPSATYKLDVNGEASINGVRVGRGAGNEASNTAVGASALNANTTALNNSAFGNQALLSTTTGGMNVALGVTAMRFNTSGFQNVAVGVSAGHFTNSYDSNVASDNSVYLGYETKASASGNTNEIVIGASALGGGSNTVTLGNSSITNTYLKGQANVATINNATTDTDKFLVSDGGVVKYRTGAEALSDIGGASASSISGTTNYIPKFTSSSAIGNSIVQDLGTGISVGGTTTSNGYINNQASSVSSSGGMFRLSNGYTYFVGSSIGNGSILGNGDGTATIQARSPAGNNGYLIFETGAGSERMRLDASGNLGIGTSSPAAKLDVTTGIRVNSSGIVTSGFADGVNMGTWDALGYNSAGNTIVLGGYRSSQWSALGLYTSGTLKATLDASGNLGLGVTPSAWVSTSKGFQIGSSGWASISQQHNGSTNIMSNAYESSSNTFTYIANANALRYNQNLNDGSHSWHIAPATIGTISFTQAMTLFSTGNLAVGGTSDAGYRLDITGTGRYHSSGGGEVLRITGGNGFVNSMYIGVPNTSAEGLKLAYNSNDGSSEINNIYNASLYLKTNNTTRLTIAGSGAATFSSSVTATDFIANNRIIAKAAAQSNPSGAGSVVIDYQSTSDLQGRIRSRDWDAAAWKNLTLEANNIILSPSGNVGIGTTSPAQKLVVDNGASSTYIQVVGQSRNMYLGQDATGAAIYSDGAVPMYFSTNAAERMRITSGGNVGIGTTSPTRQLELSKTGGADFGITAVTSGTADAIFKGYASGTNVDATSSRGSSLSLINLDATNGNANGIIFHNSNQLSTSYIVGVNVNHTSRTGDLVFGTSNAAAPTERMRITSGGNVGIGTTSPTSTLHTNGSLATAYSSKTATYTLTSSDHTIRFDAVTAAASLTANLPDATTCAGRVYVIVAKMSASYNVTLDGNGSQTIGGSTAWGLWDGCNADATIVIQSDGANWQIISYYGFNSTC